ncbi:heavy metal translocating P-type ATPase [Dactylosporangium sp. CA-092794]|uniref:heavy metal translocating P-type ATPase n=1 Tax=Dactylosporangium sp. CA-092794 TaxID=3239929 RepID=UPI003D932714
MRDVRMLAATGVLAVEAPVELDDGVLLRTAAASGLTLEPEHTSKGGDTPRRSKRWWMRPEMITLAVAAVLLIAAEVSELVLKAETPALVLALASIVIGIVYPLRSTWTMLRMKRFSINLLLIVAVVGAITLGRAGEAADLVVIFSLGAVLESYVADRARRSIQALMDLSPQMAERFRSDGLTDTVPVEELGVGDQVLVRPGSRLPSDGEVVEGTSWVDASAITGESMPVEVNPGTVVYGGTLNGDSALRIEVAKPYVDTVLARVIREVEEAQANRGRAQRFADQFSNIYTPSMIGLAILMAIFGPVVLGLTLEEAVYRGLVVLIVSCSCALVLSVPVSVVSAVARAARDGVLIKGGAYLERLADLSRVAFDKTGTLTRGRPVLVEVHTLNDVSETELLALAAGVEAGATHPIADAIVRAARDRGLQVRPLPDTRTIAGVGAEATVDGRKVAVGRVPALGADRDATRALAAVEAAGATPVAVIDNGRLIGLLGVADELRPDARAAVDGLRRLGITHTVMLTGDRERVARAIADQLGIEEVRAELMPEDKSAAVNALRAGGTVAMVGDGVNDAPALATADVAIVMGAAGTDVALETADVALMADDLTKLPYAVALARRSRRNVNQNVVLSMLMVVLLVTTALTGAFTLTQGVLANEGYALVIIANGLRLLRRRPLRRYLGVSHSDSSVTAAVGARSPIVASVTAPTRQTLPLAGSACGCVPTSAAESACGCGPTINKVESACGCGDTTDAGSAGALQPQQLGNRV